MRFEEWEPVYEAILADFGFARSADEAARDRLSAFARPFDWNRLAVVSTSSVAIVGGAASLVEDLGSVRSADVVFAASNAAAILRDARVAIDLMTTDLDKVPSTAEAVANGGTPVAIHAHGDNVSAIERWLPRFPIEEVLATTQAAPVPSVDNVGGFTDGDRAAFIADHLGAAELRFPGWDFDDPTVGATKRRKLAWAERLLYWLEHRRNERFSVLDGRRDRISPVWR